MKNVRYYLVFLILILVFLFVIFINVNQNLNNISGGKTDFLSSISLKSSQSGDSKSSESSQIPDSLSGDFIVMNEVEYFVETTLRADIKPVLFSEGEEFPDECKFIGGVMLPSEYNLYNAFYIYTRSNLDSNDYDQIHDYYFSYRGNNRTSGDNGDNNYNNIRIAFSKLETPVRLYYAFNRDDFQKSRVKGVDVEFQEYGDLYIALFKVNNLYFDIESLGASFDEVLNVVENVIDQVKNFKAMGY